MSNHKNNYLKIEFNNQKNKNNQCNKRQLLMIEAYMILNLDMKRWKNKFKISILDLNKKILKLKKYNKKIDFKVKLYIENYLIHK